MVASYAYKTFPSRLESSGFHRLIFETSEENFNFITIE